MPYGIHVLHVFPSNLPRILRNMQVHSNAGSHYTMIIISLFHKVCPANDWLWPTVRFCPHSEMVLSKFTLCSPYNILKFNGTKTLVINGEFPKKFFCEHHKFSTPVVDENSKVSTCIIVPFIIPYGIHFLHVFPSPLIPMPGAILQCFYFNYSTKYAVLMIGFGQM
jgi:hypothetical protein